MDKLKAYEQFMAKLVNGELNPGQFVTIKELAALADVPLAAAREAIQRLESESLLRVYPQRGVQVTEASPKYIRDAFGFRALLECGAIRRFALEIPTGRLQELTQTIDDIIDASSDGITRELQEKAVEIDWRIHDAIIDFFDNELVAEAYRINATRIRLIRGQGNRPPAERLVEVMREHKEILITCSQRDPDAAFALLEKHIMKALERTFTNA